MKITRGELRQIIREQVLLNEKSYKVQVGDTMHGIASKHSVSIGALLDKNKQFDKSKLSDWKRGDKPDPSSDRPGATSGRNPNWIYPGESIEIPSGTGSSKSQATASTVRPKSPAPGAGSAPPVADNQSLATAAAKEEKSDPCAKLRVRVSQELAPLKDVLDDFEYRFDQLNSRKIKTGRRLRLKMLKDIEENELNSIRSMIEKLKEIGIEVEQSQGSDSGSTTGREISR